MLLGLHDTKGDAHIISFYANLILQEGKQRPGWPSSLTTALVLYLKTLTWQGQLNLCSSPKNSFKLQTYSRSQMESLNASTANFSNKHMNQWIKYIPRRHYFCRFHTTDWPCKAPLCFTLLYFQGKWHPLSADTCSNPIKFFAQRLFLFCYVCVHGDKNGIKPNSLLTIFPAVFVIQSQVFDMKNNYWWIRQKIAQIRSILLPRAAS